MDQRNLNILISIKYFFVYTYAFLFSFYLERNRSIQNCFSQFSCILILIIFILRILEYINELQDKEIAAEKINKMIKSHLLKKRNITINNKFFMVNFVNDFYIRNRNLYQIQLEKYYGVQIKKEKSYIICEYNEEVDDDCFICYEKLNNKGIKLLCGHHCHAKCIKKWFQMELDNKKDNIFPFSCPLCRLVIPNYYSKPKIYDNKLYLLSV